MSIWAVVSEEIKFRPAVASAVHPMPVNSNPLFRTSTCS
jgi:hypothetical protein